ncbi:ribose 5-phosphate isomerase B [Desulfovibrio ferrophilus]|uniref:Ribose-5-phosphate isomerase B n=1 Tax=Desulfovibrio ferrophilus TaxID=241368 RepID=A0A2Z6AX95_9BACT|nr:ribose 5-phosphate isomerase B [Desulfovibrio ferrophilus]BBD07874.1 ribose-5-phosphate isomerase B [Desulfovibrio ferrophilus]
MSKIKVALGSDHAGYALKETLKQHLIVRGFEPVDVGTMSTDSCDYPAIAKDLCKTVLDENIHGVLVCGTGIGMSMAANRHEGIRAAVCANAFQCEMTRKHNDCNVLCVGERVTGVGAALSILDIFLDTEFEGGRHQRRVDLIELD